MSLSPETITQLQSMLKADPALLAQVQASDDAASSAAVLIKAAATKGIAVSASDIAAYVDSVSAKQGAMSDSELEQVAGGRDYTALSIFTLGIGCAVASIARAASGGDCKKELNL